MARFTIASLQDTSDVELLTILLNERMKLLNRYAPLYGRLVNIREKLEKKLPLTNSTPRLWMRMGDSSDYQSYAELSGVVDELAEHQVFGPIVALELGISADGFEGQNYISLYWGDSQCQVMRPVSRQEMGALRKLLKERKSASV